MAINLTVNGVSYSYPQTGDSNWGAGATNWASAVTSGMLSKAGGAFSLTADVDFGSSFGLKALYLISKTANPSGTGFLRLANADGIGWRNVGNSADYLLKPDADGILQYNSIDLVNLSATQTLTGKSMSGSSNTFTNLPFSGFAALTSGNILVGSASNVAASVAMSGDVTITNAGVTAIGTSKVLNAMLAGSITYSKLILTGAILNADLAGSIAYSKLSLTGAILNADLAGSITYSKLILTGAVLNADLAGSIAYSKLVLTGAILNADLAGSIAYSKLSLTGAILNADLAGSITAAKLVGSDIATVGTITSGTWAGTTVAINHGGTGVTAVTTAPAASTFAGWDANLNISANNLIDGYATTATAAATTTLTVASAGIQYFTGSTTQTVKLPVVATGPLPLGFQFTIVNLSSGIVTVQSSGANTLQAMAQNTQLVATVISQSGTGTASWNWQYTSIQNSLAGGGSVTSVAMTVPTFLSVSGSPVTTTGTLAVTLSGTALPVLNGGTGVTTSTGSGNAVLSTSPTLVTPILGTPTSGTMTNVTGLPLTSGVTGTLPLGNGGTGATSVASNGIVFGSGTSNYTSSTSLTYDGTTLKVQNTGAADTEHEINNLSTTNNTLKVRNQSTNSSSDGTAAIDIVKGSTTNTTSQAFIYFSVNAGVTGSGKITANGASSAAFGTLSDQRLKKNIQDLPSQLGNILALRPVDFDYKDGSGHQVGFIAQEMRAVYPDAVSSDERTGMLSIAGWDKTSSRLVKALQEMSAKNSALEARIAALEAR